MSYSCSAAQIFELQAAKHLAEFLVEQKKLFANRCVTAISLYACSSSSRFLVLLRHCHNQVDNHSFLILLVLLQAHPGAR